MTRRQIPNSLFLLFIGFLAAAVIDVTFAMRHELVSDITSFVVFFTIGIYYYDKIVRKPILNSIVIFLCISLLLLFAYGVNEHAVALWSHVSICTVLGYAAGIITKKITATKNNPAQQA